MSIGTKALSALLGGILVGLALAGRAASAPILTAAHLVGTLWIDAILMTLVPLIVSKVVVSIAGADDGRLIATAGWQAVALMIALLAAGAVGATFATAPLFARLSVDPAASASLRAAAAPAPVAPPPTVADSVIGLVPLNPIRAAADGAIVPLLVFSILFALALSRAPAATRDPVVGVLKGVDAAITILLHWIIALSPVGVFALGLEMTLRVGVGIAGAIGVYVAVSSLVLVAFTLLLYVLVALTAKRRVTAFARACIPSQVVAFSTHSSMASLPAMLEGASTTLRLPRSVGDFLLTFTVSTFKYSSPIWFMTAVFFVARLYGIPMAAGRLVPTVVTAVLTSFAVGGVPSGAVVMVAPVLAAAGLPAEALGVLLAVDPIPNAFRTVANVTGDLAVTAIVGSHQQSE